MITSWTLQHFMLALDCGAAYSSSLEVSSILVYLSSSLKGQLLQHRNIHIIPHNNSLTTMCVIHFIFICVTYRSIEEVIALFISIAFVADALKGTFKSKWLFILFRYMYSINSYFWILLCKTVILMLFY